jgi:beta-xylosidase
VVTSNDAPNSFPILRSKDLNHWEFVSFVFPEGSKPEWAADGEFISDYWAAEMHQVGDEFRVYFVARDKENLELCIGLAVSSSPEGPFIAAPHPILKGNIIDPHIFIKGPNITYLYWKEDNNDVWPGKLIELLYNHPHLVTSLFDKQEDQLTAVFIKTLWPWTSTLPPMERFLVLQVLIEVIIANFSSFYKRLSELLRTEHKSLHDDIKTVLQFMKTPMYAQQLSPDGLRFEGERIRILENDLDWEAHLVEGMWVTQHLDSYYLFYAGNDFSTDQYGIGVAIGKSPLGPFTKMQTPFLRSTTKWWAPGHPSIVTDTQGVQTMFLHAYFPGKAGYKEFRALLSTPLTFKEDEVLLGV